MLRPPRNHRAYWAFVGHRLSGIALALFLPFHLIALSIVLDQARFDAFLEWNHHPLIRIAEWGLVVSLGLHMFFGLRLLANELWPWRPGDPGRVGWIVPSVVVSVVAGTIFLVGAL